MDSILLTDGYKLDHRRQYPSGTEYVYSNWTPRSNQYFPEASEGVVVFGLLSLSDPFLVSGMIMCASLLTYILSAVAAVNWY